MSFFGFDAALPREGDDRFREGPELGSLGGFEYEDEFELRGDEDEDVQDFLETEQEADAVNLDTFGDAEPPSGAHGRDDGSAVKVDRAPRVGECRRKWCQCSGKVLTRWRRSTGKDFDFAAANRSFEQKVQRNIGPNAPQTRAGPGGRPTEVSPQTQDSSIKSLWDGAGPAGPPQPIQRQVEPSRTSQVKFRRKARA